MTESYISMRRSKDGGNTWNDWKTRSLGDIGSFARPAIWRRLGNGEQFTFSFRADGVPDIVSAFVLGADGQWAPAPIAQGAYKLDTRLVSAQDCVNYIPERVERPNGVADWFLRGAPGYRLFANVGDGPIRGARDVEGKLIVVSGTEVYLVNRDTSTTLLGTMPGEGRVSITHNQEDGGSKVVLANGTRGYTYDTITGTYAQITDPAFPGFLVCDYLDQYILGIEPQRRYAFHSELADAQEYSAVDVFEAEGAPDRLMGQAVIGGQWWLFGERTTEIFANTGAATGTFQRIPGATIDRGLASTHAVAKLDNALWILGDDGIVYRSNGYAFVRVSTHAVEHSLRLVDQTRVFFQTFEDAGHKILYVTCPDGHTWGYDVATDEWHRRESAGLARWRMATLVKWAGVWLVGDFQLGKLYQLDWALKDEDGTTLTGLRTTGTLVNASNRFTVSGVKLLCDTGRGEEALTGVRAIIDPLVIYNRMGAVYVGDPVSHQYLSTGGVRPHTFAISAGTLPAGLSMDSDGLVTGTPTTSAAYSWRVTVTDARGFTASLDEGQNAGLGIDGPDPFYVLQPPPTLLTNTKFYTGARDALVLDDPSGFTSVDRLFSIPGGTHVAAAIYGGITSSRFQWRKWDGINGEYDALPNPSDMPTVGPHAMAWSPDGRYLAMGVSVAAPGNLLIYERTGDTLTLVSQSEGPPDLGYGVGFDGPGQRLAIGNGNSAEGVYVYDFIDGQLSNGKTISFTDVASVVAFQTPTGARYLAVGSDDGIDVIACTETPMRRAGGLNASTDPKYAAKGGLYWDASNGYLIAVATSGADPVNVFRFDGSVIGSETLTWESSADVPPSGGVSGSAFSADGAYLAVAHSGSNSPAIYEVSDTLPPTLTKLPDPASTGSAVTFPGWTDF